jgi:hypothetical protein
MDKRDELRRSREALKRQYGAAFGRLSEILFTEDPVGISFDENTDEYDPEAGTILPRLGSCRSVDDVLRVVYEECLRGFTGTDHDKLQSKK